MASKRYLLMTRGLAKLNQNRLRSKANPSQQETDALFYWILGRLEWSIQYCWPAQPQHTIVVQECSYPSNRVLLRQQDPLEYVSGKAPSEYHSLYVTKSIFYAVMQDVASLFNEIGVQEKDKYAFSASCSFVNGYAQLKVTMSTKL